MITAHLSRAYGGSSGQGSKPAGDPPVTSKKKESGR